MKEEKNTTEEIDEISIYDQRINKLKKYLDKKLDILYDKTHKMIKNILDEDIKEIVRDEIADYICEIKKFHLESEKNKSRMNEIEQKISHTINEHAVGVQNVYNKFLELENLAKSIILSSNFKNRIKKDVKKIVSKTIEIELSRFDTAIYNLVDSSIKHYLKDKIKETLE